MNELLHIFKEALEIENKALSMTDEFRNYPEWNSLAFLSVISMIDDAYGAVIDPQVFRQLRTIQDVFNEIQKIT